MSENVKVAMINDGDQIKIEVTSPEMDKILRSILPCEVELNRAWIYDDEDEDAIGETNFVVSEGFAKKVFEEKYADYYSDFEEFMDVYEPEEEGEYIYQRAIAEGELKEDLGKVLYDECEDDDEENDEQELTQHMLIITRTGFNSEHEEIRGTLTELRKRIRKMYDDCMTPSDDDDDVIINGHNKEEWSKEIVKKDEITLSYFSGMECITTYAFIITV